MNTEQMQLDNNTLIDTLEQLDNTARIAALRGLVHSSMSKTIFLIRQHLRQQRNAQRDAEESNQLGLDQRNEYDENNRAANEGINKLMGFEEPVDYLLEASKMHALYDWANMHLETLGTTRWEKAMSLAGMLEFMTKESRPMNEEFAKTLAELAQCDVSHIKLLDEVQYKRERELLLEEIPAIVSIFESFGENGSPDAFNNLGFVEQHQLAIKIVEALIKAKNSVLLRAMRSRNLGHLSDIKILDDARDVTAKWVEGFEDLVQDALTEALEQGRNIRTLDDLAKEHRVKFNI